MWEIKIEIERGADRGRERERERKRDINRQIERDTHAQTYRARGDKVKSLRKEFVPISQCRYKRRRKRRGDNQVVGMTRQGEVN